MTVSAMHAAQGQDVITSAKTRWYVVLYGRSCLHHQLYNTWAPLE